MIEGDPGGPPITGWYELFSRGARDWLRHNEKVREAVRAHLPEIVAGADVLGGGARTVRVPVRMLEHYHFRLRSPEKQQGAGQGAAKPGDVLAQPSPGKGSGRGSGGREDGGIEFLLELKVDDIVDWLWEEMELPNLQARVGQAQESDYVREGWDRRGARSRLDRRRSLKESVKRRGVSGEPASFTDEDLRFRQLARRRQPTTQAVVFLALDVSGSMTDQDRKLAKSFFFWAVQGLRRQYRHLDTVFVAHTTEAWEIDEQQFFQASGSGGTVTSTALRKAREIVEERYSPSRYNIYLFYASDGDNAATDRADSTRELTALCDIASYAGFLEVSAGSPREPLTSETARIFEERAAAGQPVGRFAAGRLEDIWQAVKHFFRHQAGSVA